MLEDVAWWISPQAEFAPFFADLGKANQRLIGAEPLVYDITFEQQQDASRATITIRLIKGSTANVGESLLQLTLGDMKQTSQGKQQWSVLNWVLE
ncbi:MAG: hypothetical protein JOZ52_04155 [Acidobacteria bacterium]|nr:hypothetical protein [Acidobacteriota bacterium]